MMKRLFGVLLSMVGMTAFLALPAGATTGVTVNATYANLSGAQPLDIVADAAGNVYTSNADDTISKITPSGATTVAWATLPSGSYPYYLAVDGAGNVYTSNYSGYSVSKILPDGTIAWTTTLSGEPGSIVLGIDGHIYVTIYANGAGVVRLDTAGVIDPSYTPHMPPGWTPWAMTQTPDGELWLSAYTNADLFKIDPDGTMHTVLPQILDLHANAYFMRVGPDGSIYIVNQGSDTITKVASDGSIDVTWATFPAGSAPYDIAFDAAGNGYVTQYYTDQVAKVSPDGTVTPDWATLPASSTPWSIIAVGSHDFFVSLYGSSYVAKISTKSSPVITSISPNEGIVTGGTKITITGTDFLPGATVQVGGAACAEVVVVSTTSITCTTPAGTVGSVSVTVDNGDGATASGSFTYTAALAATGSSTDQWILGAGLLLMLGGALVLMARRRANSAA